MTTIVRPLEVEAPTRDSGLGLEPPAEVLLAGMLTGSTFSTNPDQRPGVGWNDPTDGVELDWDVLQQLKPLESQAGGHKYEEKNTNKGAFIGCLQSKKMGTVLKRLQEAIRGERELNFYKSVFLEEHDVDVYEDILQLRNFLPAFYGMFMLSNAKYIMLSDLTCGYERPCVIDVKMGTQTYDPDADVVKRNREAKKYCNIKDVGFCVTAYRIYDHQKKEFRLIEDEDGKNYWRLLSRDRMRHEFLRLLPSSPRQRRRIVDACLRRLLQMRLWFRRQRLFSFYSSSILIVYEGVVEDVVSSPDSSTDDSGVSSIHDAGFTDASFADSSANDDAVDVNGLPTSGGELVSPAAPRDQVDSGGGEFEDAGASPPPVRLHMIDFAHAYCQSEINVASDEGYLVGLDNLIDQFQTYI